MGTKRRRERFGRRLRPVYSKNFLKTGTQTTGNFDYVVPTGYRASIKGMTAYKAVAATPVDVFFGIFAPGDATLTPVWIAVMLGTTKVESMVWNGTVVIEAGWTLRATRSTAAGTWSASASGFLLTAV